ncbi:hypothetical protein EVAR_68453_1 [Eumeta japonica]|uniref:Uncharacterized protein n=1 Tax=Eumeta variegata TaxID=151549 RepID=A0A4C2A081_EUMVA|nr:hypothetical protein EVAR_68453_1 [Eumeta japonica]
MYLTASGRLNCGDDVEDDGDGCGDDDLESLAKGFAQEPPAPNIAMFGQIRSAPSPHQILTFKSAKTIRQWNETGTRGRLRGARRGEVVRRKRWNPRGVAGRPRNALDDLTLPISTQRKIP